MKAVKKWFAALALVPSIVLPSVSAAEDIELVEVMAQLQYFSHKASLSIDNKNMPLLEFYLHEMEEYVAEASKVESYDGHAIGKLVDSLLKPSMTRFDAAVTSGNWGQISQRFDQVVNACNSCHQLTEHGFIKVERVSHNPFMQSF